MGKAEGDPGKKPKRPYTKSEAMYRANRLNSQLSTGPRDPAARKKVGQNSRKRPINDDILIEGEDAAELASVQDLWAASIAAETPVELYFSRLAAIATIRLQRALVADAAALRGRIREIRRGRREHQKRKVARLAARLLEAPADVVTRLREFSLGVTWLIEQWTRIHNRLTYTPGVLRSERERAGLLMGKPLTDIYTDDQLEAWNFAYLATLSLADGKPVDLEFARKVFDDDRPLNVSIVEHEVRLAHWLKVMPPPEQALATLQATVAGTLKELTKLRTDLEADEAEDIEIEAGKARVDRTIEGARRLRHEQAFKNDIMNLTKLARSMRESRLAGVFEQVVQAGMSPELIALLEAQGAAEDDAQRDADQGDASEVDAAAAAEVAEPVSPVSGAPAGTPEPADPGVESPVGPDLQSKADSAPEAEPKSAGDGEVTADASALPKPIPEPVPGPPPAQGHAARTWPGNPKPPWPGSGSSAGSQRVGGGAWSTQDSAPNPASRRPPSPPVTQRPPQPGAGGDFHARDS